MNHDTLLETVAEILDNQRIQKTGLSLVYTLDEPQHKYFQDFFSRSQNPQMVEVIYTDTFFVNIAGMEIKFVKKES